MKIILSTKEYEGTAYVSWPYKVFSSSIQLSCCSEKMNRWKVQHSRGHKYSLNITLTSLSNCLRYPVFVFVSNISNACKTLGAIKRPLLSSIYLLWRRNFPFTQKSFFCFDHTYFSFFLQPLVWQYHKFLRKTCLSFLLHNIGIKYMMTWKELPKSD